MGFRLLAGLRAASILVVSSLPLSAEPIHWNMATEYPRDSVSGAGVERFATELTQRSGGRIVVAPSVDAEAGFKGVALVNAIEVGRLAAGDSFAGPLGEVDPIFLLSSLPFLATSFEDAQCLYRAAQLTYAATLARHHLRLLYATPWPPTGLWTKKPLLQLNDLKGMVLRTYDETSSQVFKALGAEAASISFADAMLRLKGGSLQGVLSSGDGGAGRRLWEYLPSFTAVNYAVPLSLAVVHTHAFEALSPDLQQVVEAASSATDASQWQLVRTRVEADYAQMKVNGVTVSADLTAEFRGQLAEAAKHAIEAWKKTVGSIGSDILAGRCRTAH
jgi:TRAP-type C4-dicarboxylate transport system substrate-binding protein